MRIPITMCHGVSWRPRPKRRLPFNRLTRARFEEYFRIAAEMEFESISYDDLAQWRGGWSSLPAHAIMFDFDHPDVTIGRVIRPIMDRYGFRGNLFINTAPIEKPFPASGTMLWDEIGDLMQAGWHIGSHTHNHYDLDFLARKDPSGDAIGNQLDTCDELIQRHLGVRPRDFAYTSSTWSEIAEKEVAKRYRFARLWITGEPYQTDQGPIRYAELVGARDADEDDGGPPFSARYITEHSDPLKLPSMELEHLIFGFDSYKRYLSDALN